MDIHVHVQMLVLKKPMMCLKHIDRLGRKTINFFPFSHPMALKRKPENCNLYWRLTLLSIFFFGFTWLKENDSKKNCVRKCHNFLVFVLNIDGGQIERHSNAFQLLFSPGNEIQNWQLTMNSMKGCRFSLRASCSHRKM